MKQIGKLLTKISGHLDLPADIVAGVPRIELVGTQQCSVEPHHGLLSYSKEEIILATQVGALFVHGTSLEIKQMHQGRITVIGKINQVCISEE